MSSEEPVIKKECPSPTPDSDPNEEIIDFEVNTNWVCHGRSIVNSFIGLNDNEIVQLTDIISPETCVMLKKPADDESDDPPNISLKLKTPGQIMNKVYLLCEVGLAEIYGAMGEYLKTMRGENIDVVDGTNVFGYAIEEFSTTELLLKFAGYKKRTFWIYGARLGVTARHPLLSLFDMPSIQARLGGTELSSRAMRLCRLMAAGGGPWPAVAGRLPTSAPPPATLETIKQYIDESFALMEKRILRHFSLQIKELESKQNESISAIIRLLDSRLSAAEPEP